MQPIKLAENLRKYGRQNFAIKCVNHANSMSFVVGSFPIKTKIADFFGMLKGNVGPKYGGWVGQRQFRVFPEIIISQTKSKFVIAPFLNHPHLVQAPRVRH